MYYNLNDPNSPGIDKCSICGETITGTKVCTTKDFFAHPYCYEVTHPPKLADSILDIVRNPYDPIIIAQIIEYIIPKTLATHIINTHNITIIQNWKMRCRVKRFNWRN